MHTSFQNYILGFMFNEDKSKVVLIRKNNPSWQKGYLNGVGGKLELHETILNGMVREFQEETSVHTSIEQWHQFAEMYGQDWAVYCFKSFNNIAIENVKSNTKEEIIVLEVKDLLNHKTLSNIPWLVYMALDENMGNPDFYSKINYSYTK